MMNKDAAVRVRLTTAMQERLKELANSSGESVSEYVRRRILNHIEEEAMCK